MLCPDRHSSTNLILSPVAIVLLQYDVIPISRCWEAPRKCNADIWNRMPKPDSDVDVRLVKSVGGEVAWEFVWGDGGIV